MAQNLRDGVTPAGSRLVMSSIGTKVWSEPYLNCWVILRDEVTLWVETVLDLILDRNEDFSDFYLGGSGPSRWGHPLGSSLQCGLTHLIKKKASFLNHIPGSFGMRSPCGSSVVVGPHLITNEGFHWWLGQDPSGWGHPFRVRLHATWSRVKDYLGLSLWRHIAVPSSIGQCWYACAIYKSFRECLSKWNFHIRINFNILTWMIYIVPPIRPTL